jgi:mono/diheme cytochrome c family protein
MKTPVLVIVAAGLFIVLAVLSSFLNRATADNQDPEGAKKAIAEAAEVLFHPRCLNCHPSGDAPLIRDDSQPHPFNVKRGPEGKGVGAMNCTLCHRDANQPGGPPGVVNWHMPPENMPMVFQGRTPGELCRQLKDPKLNGGKTGEQIIEHISKDPLVTWGWNPGEGRTTPKMSHKDFSAKMNEWVKKGAACPE